MKVAFFDTKPYDHIWFDILAREYGYEFKYFDSRLSKETAMLAGGCEAVCVFVNDDVSAPVIERLQESAVKVIALRCSGYNNVDLAAAKNKMSVVRVPSYSPTAVAEHAVALLLSVNRKTHRAYSRTRDHNFAINGLMGFDLRDKTAGVVGTGQIGLLFAEIAKGLGMRVLAYDIKPQPGSGLEYVDLDKLFSLSDVISLHCPLTEDTRHLINDHRITQMKDGAVIINTSRGALINTQALLSGLLSEKIGAAGLDVYEEEEHYFFEDKSNEVIQDDELARLLSLPNVLVTSHQAFFTKEAMQAIAMVTLENLHAFAQGKPLKNEIKAR